MSKALEIEGQRYVPEGDLLLANGAMRKRAELALLVRDLCLTYMQNPEVVNVPLLRQRAANALLTHDAAPLLGEDFLLNVRREWERTGRILATAAAQSDF